MTIVASQEGLSIREDIARVAALVRAYLDDVPIHQRHDRECASSILLAVGWMMMDHGVRCSIQCITLDTLDGYCGQATVLNVQGMEFDVQGCSDPAVINQSAIPGLVATDTPLVRGFSIFQWVDAEQMWMSQRDVAGAHQLLALLQARQLDRTNLMRDTPAARPRL